MALEANIERLAQEAANRKVPGQVIISPWEGMEPRLRAQTHLNLLANTYGGGHPGSVASVENIMDAQASGHLLTWIVQHHNNSVGMVNFSINGDRIAEAVRSVELRSGSPLPDGTIYNGEARIGAAMIQRVVDLLKSEQAKSLNAIEGDVRMATDIQLPDGNKLPGGVATQHLNHLCGLQPYLLCVPRYEVDPTGGKPHQEIFLQSRLYLQPPITDEQIYTPQTNPTGSVSMADIIHATYFNGLGIDPQIVSDSYDTTTYSARVEHKAKPHYSQIRLDGNVPIEEMKVMIREALATSRMAEIIISNQPINIGLQRHLMEIGLIPLGAFPGIKGQTETTLHYGALRQDLIPNIVNIALARDYNNTSIPDVSHALREMWSNQKLKL